MDVFEKGKRRFRMYAAFAITLAMGLVGWGVFNLWAGRSYEIDPLILLGAVLCLWIYTLVDAGRTIDILIKENYILRRQNIDKDRHFVRAQDARLERLMR